MLLVRKPDRPATHELKQLSKLSRGVGGRNETPSREAIQSAAATTWISPKKMRDDFNLLLGSKLTTTDVAQTHRAIQDEGFGLHPHDALKERCYSLYQRERDAGTEMPPIIGALQEYLEQEAECVRIESDQRWKLA